MASVAHRFVPLLPISLKSLHDSTWSFRQVLLHGSIQKTRVFGKARQIHVPVRTSPKPTSTTCLTAKGDYTMIATATPQPPSLESFEKLIHQQAYYCWQRLLAPKALEMDDLHQEGALVYLLALDKWKPNKGKFITLLHIMLQHHFARILSRAHRTHLPTYEMGISDETAVPWFIADPPDTREATRRIIDHFYEIVSRLSWRFVRELLDPSEAFQDWERVRYKNPAKSPRTRKCRVVRFMGLDRSEVSAIRRELAVKLSRGLVA